MSPGRQCLLQAQLFLPSVFFVFYIHYSTLLSPRLKTKTLISTMHGESGRTKMQTVHTRCCCLSSSGSSLCKLGPHPETDEYMLQLLAHGKKITTLPKMHSLTVSILWHLPFLLSFGDIFFQQIQRREKR